MSIDRVNISNRGIESAQGLQGIDAVRNAAKNRQAQTSSDTLDISSRAKDVERLTTKLDDNRAERLNQVRQALEAGTYHVSGEKIARKLIDTNTF